MAIEGMTWKEFQKWCNERACDGCWGYREARTCIRVMEYIRKLPFWRRKKTWKKVEQLMLNKIIIPTNQKIEEVRRHNTEQVLQALDELVGGKSGG